MALKDREVNQIGEWLEKKGVRGPCPACSRRDWGLSDIVGFPVLNDDGKTSVDEYVPAAFAVCSNCGFIMPFSARIIGLR